MTVYVCDCGRTKVTVEDPATYPYSEDSAQVQCNSCGTYVKDYDSHLQLYVPGAVDALGEIARYVEAEWREGEKPYQVAIIARDALATSGRTEETLSERVAEALYERAMSERRAFSKADDATKSSRRWRDEPYVPPVAEGESRPTNWRDDWRDQARKALNGEHGKAVLPNSTRTPQTVTDVEVPDPVEALEAERERLYQQTVDHGFERQAWCEEVAALEAERAYFSREADRMFAQKVAAEVGRDQANKERDEAREQAATNARLSIEHVDAANARSDHYEKALREVKKGLGSRSVGWTNGLDRQQLLDIACSALAGVPGGPADSDEGCAEPHPQDKNVLCELRKNHLGDHSALTWPPGVPGGGHGSGDAG